MHVSSIWGPLSALVCAGCGLIGYEYVPQASSDSAVVEPSVPPAAAGGADEGVAPPADIASAVLQVQAVRVAESPNELFISDVAVSERDDRLVVGGYARGESSLAGAPVGDASGDPIAFVMAFDLNAQPLWRWQQNLGLSGGHSRVSNVEYCESCAAGRRVYFSALLDANPHVFTRAVVEGANVSIIMETYLPPNDGFRLTAGIADDLGMDPPPLFAPAFWGSSTGWNRRHVGMTVTADGEVLAAGSSGRDYDLGTPDPNLDTSNAGNNVPYLVGYLGGARSRAGVLCNECDTYLGTWGADVSAEALLRYRNGRIFCSGGAYGGKQVYAQSYPDLGSPGVLFAASEPFLGRQAPDWLFHFRGDDGSGGSERASITATAPTEAGGAYFAGHFSGALSIRAVDQGISAVGGEDILFGRIAPDGTLLWWQTFGSAADDAIQALAERPDGTVLALLHLGDAATLPSGEVASGTQLVAVAPDGSWLRRFELDPSGALELRGQLHFLQGGNRLIFVANALAPGALGEVAYNASAQSRARGVLVDLLLTSP